jgi:signal transduction histidine kinase
MIDDNNKLIDSQILSSRQNLGLIMTQIKSGQIDSVYATGQLEKIDALLDRIAQQRQQRVHGHHFEALYNVSRVLGSSLDLQIVLDQVIDAIIHLTNAERGFLMLRDDDGGLTVKVARNLDQQTLTSEQFKFSRTVVNQVMDSGQSLLTTNAAEDPRFASKESIVAQSLRSIMAAPLRARGHVIGVAYVDSRAMIGLFSDEDLTAMDTFSAQAAIAIDNAILFSETDQELARRLEQLRQLRRIDLLLNETLDSEKAVAYTLEWACRLSNATSGYLGFVEGHPIQINEASHYGKHPSETQSTTVLSKRFPAALQVVESGTSQLIEEEERRIYIVPIRRETQTIGVVVLVGDHDAFTDEQQDIVERVVARAAVTIENATLYAAVQAADRAKSEFVGIVAHDLKAPMTGIRGYAELMEMIGGVSERHKTYIERIKDTVNRMEILVSDLADISRIESGHFFMEEGRTPVAGIIQAVKDSTLPQIEKRRHTYVENIEPDLPDLWVDYYRLVQVLVNLVSNAYKYTPDGGTITLRARRVQDRVEFSVQDTGIGLDEKSIAMLGTKFWRAEDEYTRSQPGTGLGFSITSSLIEQMGDRIRIESEIGRGSTFIFSVPIIGYQK